MLRYAITDRSYFTGDEAARKSALVEQGEHVGVEGVDFLQLREKDLDAATLAALARKLLAKFRARALAPKLLINSRADIAAATGADGVHLTSAAGSLTPADVRRVYAEAGLPVPVVSISCHALSEIARARDLGASLILFGPVFEKVITGDNLVAQGIGLNLLHLACAAAKPVPVLALGGITAENTADCLAAGASGIAGIRLFLN